MFNSIEDIIEKISEFNDYTKGLVTFATAFGAIILFILTIRIAYRLIQVIRLYFFSQYFCKTNFVEQYGQWAVISGATDGIGQSMAKELASSGMSIIVIGRNDEKLANTKAMLEQVPNVGEVETVKIDLSNPSLENFDKIKGQIDPENRDIGILINNAGMFPANFTRFNRYDMSYLVSMVNLNITATLHLTRMIMPGMMQRGKGMVLNVSSSLGPIPGPYLSVYAPTKAFIDSFTRQLQMEYSAHPLRIVLLTPGPVYTKLFTDSSTVPKSLFVPSSDEFAKNVLNALSANISIFSGTMWHGFFRESGMITDTLDVLSPFFKANLMLNAKNYQLSPVPKRKHLTAGTVDNNLEAIALSGVEGDGNRNQESVRAC